MIKKIRFLFYLNLLISEVSYFLPILFLAQYRKMLKTFFFMFVVIGWDDWRVFPFWMIQKTVWTTGMIQQIRNVSLHLKWISTSHVVTWWQKYHEQAHARSVFFVWKMFCFLNLFHLLRILKIVRFYLWRLQASDLNILGCMTETLSTQ